MFDYNQDKDNLSGFFEKGEKLAAMLAPSFVIDFPYPGIIGMLKRAGFEKVVEVSRGALETNCQLIKLLQEDPHSRFITNPCPSITRLVKNKYPDLIPFLSPVDTPMSATARLVIREFPGCRPVFIGPCIAKKFEAREDYPDLKILVLTFKEIAALFKVKNIRPQESDKNYLFDMLAYQTRLYPVSGGLAQSADIKEYLSEDEYLVISGPDRLHNAFCEFKQNEKIRLLDILFCQDGCISGPGIISREPLPLKRQKVVNYWESHQ